MRECRIRPTCPSAWAPPPSRPTGAVRGRQLPVVHAGLHRRLFRHRRHRLDQDRPPLRERHGAAAIHRSQGLRTTPRSRPRTARCWRCEYDRKLQHPALGQDAVHPRDARLPARGRHDHRALRRPPPGLARHARADLRRADVRVPRAGRRLRDLQLRRAAGAAVRSRSSPARRCSARRCCRRCAACGEPFHAGLQGRGQMGQPERPRRGRFRAARQSAGRRAARDFSMRRGELRDVDRGPVGRRAGRPAASTCSTQRAASSAARNPLRIVARRAAAFLLVRPARPVGGDDRHQLGARADRVRARPGLPRRA